MSHTRHGNIIRETALTPLEREVVQACLLGDGTLTKSGRHYRLRTEHKMGHVPYVRWKFEFLKRLCISDVQTIAAHQSVRFGTVGHPEMTQLRHLWYRPRKSVPSNLVLTPLMVAIWFMDDGTRHRDTVDFSVHSFSNECLEILRHQLSFYKIETTINSDAKGARLYVLKKSYPSFERLIRPLVIECMEYKLP